MIESDEVSARIGIYTKDNIAVICAENEEMMKRFDTLCNEPGSSWELLEIIRDRHTNEIIEKYYVCPADLIKFREKE